MKVIFHARKTEFGCMTVRTSSTTEPGNMVGKIMVEINYAGKPRFFYVPHLFKGHTGGLKRFDSLDDCRKAVEASVLNPGNSTEAV